jgi:hypothetical protein
MRAKVGELRSGKDNAEAQSTQRDTEDSDAEHRRLDSHGRGQSREELGARTEVRPTLKTRRAVTIRSFAAGGATLSGWERRAATPSPISACR